MHQGAEHRASHRSRLRKAPEAHTSFVAGYVSSGELATLYAALDERDQAFALLERAYAKHDPQLRFLNADPAFDLLRDDPRFQDLLRRVGLK